MPAADIGCLFDHLVGERKQLVGHRQAERFGGSDRGTCTFTDHDCDNIFATYSGKSDGKGVERGNYEVVGGAGKYAGITGSGDYYNDPRIPIKADDKAFRGVVSNKNPATQVILSPKAYVSGKITLRVFGHAELLEPVRNLLHRGHQGSVVAEF